MSQCLESKRSLLQESTEVQSPDVETCLLNIHSVFLSPGVLGEGKGATCKMRLGSEAGDTQTALETISRSMWSRMQLRKIKISRLCVPEMWAEWNHHRNMPGQGLALREEKSAASETASGYLGQWLNSKSFIAIQPLDKVITGAPAVLTLTFRSTKQV